VQAGRRSALTIATLLVIFGIGALHHAAAGSQETELSAEEESRLREASRLRDRGLAEMEEGNHGGAVEFLLPLAEILPDNVLPPVNLAVCYLRLNRTSEAREQIQKARALDPDNPRMLFTLARLLEGDPDFHRQWLEVVDHFAEVHPRDPRPYYLRAESQARSGEHAAAVASLKRAIDQDPENLVLLAEQLVEAAHARDLETSDERPAMTP